MWPIWIFIWASLGYSSGPASKDAGSGQYPKCLSPFSRIFYPLLSQTPSVKPFPARLFTYSLFKDEIVPFFVNRTKKEPDKIQMIFTSILRQALVVMISHTPIRSVRTFFLWKLTAMTDLQMGHLILMMPSTVSGSASNNLLFLQHGQATCTSCISFRLPQEASQKGMSNWPLVIVLFSSALFAVT